MRRVINLVVGSDFFYFFFAFFRVNNSMPGSGTDDGHDRDRKGDRGASIASYISWTKTWTRSCRCHDTSSGDKFFFR